MLQFYSIYSNNFFSLQNLGAFAKLWSRLDPSGNVHAQHLVPGNLWQAWFLNPDNDGVHPPDTDAFNPDPPIFNMSSDKAPLSLANKGGLGTPATNAFLPLPDQGSNCSFLDQLPKDNPNEAMPADSIAPTPTKANTFTTYLGCTVQPSLCLQESMDQGTSNAYISWCQATLLPSIATSNMHSYTYVSSLVNQDTLTFAKAMKQADKDCFIETMEQEVVNHISQQHWEIVTH